MTSQRLTRFCMYLWVLMSSLWFSNLFSQTGALKVQWDPNSESDLAGYKVYYGTSSQNYTTVIDAGNHNEYTANDLTAGTTYYFAVTAYDLTGNESDFSEEVHGTVAIADITPPTISKVSVISLEQIEVEFSEPVTKSSAENVNNYHINGNISVLQAQLDQNEKIVHLSTTAHAGNQEYTITISGIQDLASPANTIAENSAMKYVTPQSGSEALEIVSILKQDLNKLEVVFSLNVEKASAENVENYAINNNVKIQYATLRENQRAVVLITSDHSRNVDYVLTVNNITEAGNPSNIIVANSTIGYKFEAPDVEPLLVESVSILDPKSVEICFNKPVLRESAENVKNYYIDNGVEVVEAQLLENLKVVNLKTSTHQKDLIYTITINNVKDLSTPPVELEENTSFTYVLKSVDTTPPVLLSAEIFSATKVDLEFSEPISQASAENVGNYKIDKNISIENAALDQNLKVVHLTTGEHLRGTNYTISVNNIFDLAENPNKIAANSAVSYYFKIVDNVPPEVLAVEIINENELIISFTEPLNETSAEKTANYMIDRGITVIKAELDASKMKVHLQTTAHQRGEVYTIVLNNIADLATVPNTIESNTAYSYSLPVVDLVKPTIIAAKILDESSLSITFSEKLDKYSAENENNYQINKGIVVTDAKLQVDEITVILKTSKHNRGETYLIYISGIKDQAESPNEIVSNSTSAYYFDQIDQTGPEVVSVKILNETYLEIEFNEQVTPQSAENSVNYEIDKGIQIEETALDDNLKIVYLTTSSHTRGTMYTIRINSIEDISPGHNQIARNTIKSYFLEIEDRTPPTIDSVRIWSSDHVAVYFSERVDESSAENVANYYINQGISVKTAQLQSNKRIIDLKTSNHTRGQSYRLGVSNIFDLAEHPNEIVPNTNYLYFFESVDMTPPVIVSARLINPKLLMVEFSENIDKASGQKPENYQISENIEVLEAAFEGDDHIIYLKTTAHTLEGRYLLTVNDVYDAAPIPNAIRANSTFSYSLRVDAILKNISLNHYELDSLSVGSTYYVDRDYRIMSLPESKRKILSLKTANSDRWRTDENFLSFIAEKNVKIYVGYDSRALSVPSWLEENYTKTKMNVGVSDISHEFVLWERTCTSGKVMLGGNLADGAQGAKAMYMVLVETTSEDGGGSDNPDIIPVSYKLYQNYPNPFNGGTHIRFDVPEKCHVKLTIYNILGQEVMVLKNNVLNAGQHEVNWDGRNKYGNVVGNGLYLATFEIKPEASTSVESLPGKVQRPYREVVKLTYLK